MISLPPPSLHSKCLAFCFAALTSSASFAVVTAPYANDFTGDVDDFSETADVRWTLDTTAGTYTNSDSSGNRSSASTLELSNLGGGETRDFQITTEYTISSIINDDTTIGFGALGSDSGFAYEDGINSLYLADVRLNGETRILKLDGAGVAANLASGSLTGNIGDLQTDVPYTMSLTGTYSGGNLTLDFAVSGGGDSSSISGTDTGTLLEGRNFGFRNRTHNTNGELSVGFQEISVVPEPSMAFLALASTAGLFIRRRRC